MKESLTALFVKVDSGKETSLVKGNDTILKVPMSAVADYDIILFLVLSSQCQVSAQNRMT